MVESGRQPPQRVLHFFLRRLPCRSLEMAWNLRAHVPELRSGRRLVRRSAPCPTQLGAVKPGSWHIVKSHWERPDLDSSSSDPEPGIAHGTGNRGRGELRGKEFELLAMNDLGEPSNATPAISGGQIFLRTDGHLYCIAED